MKMTPEEREAFLNEVHVAVISVPEPGLGPLTVPVWYNYMPEGEFHIWTGSDSRKVELLRETGRCSLCIQQETPPYKYVSVEGPVAMEPIQLERDLRPLVYRYLGPEEGDAYLDDLGGDTAGTGDLLIRVTPERWLSLDFAKGD
ncbi:MAG: pyridoxamine 5'-phosphate oxidase family protein [Candidatus Promineifilaceae bacterium]